MKKFVYTVFIAFWAAIATLVLVNTLAPDATEQMRQPPSEQDAEAIGYSLADVAKHSTHEDCWMVIEDVVYDVSAYAPRHPAPAGVLSQWCGREATEAMQTRGEDSEHSARAWRLLERYRIGQLQ